MPIIVALLIALGIISSSNDYTPGMFDQYESEIIITDDFGM
ncbi:MAG TPA: hypothetical protein PKA00_05280 [Saprospiraceae bacterium]|nr:hypothetical protein [Saprospiraceae bacterium]HMQ82294.1 hypothetical protein [Saprospiraceae bacterium]